MNKDPSGHGHPAFLGNPFAFQSLLGSNGGNCRAMVDWAVRECLLEALKHRTYVNAGCTGEVNRLRTNIGSELICLDLQRFFSLTSEARARKRNVSLSFF